MKNTGKRFWLRWGVCWLLSIASQGVHAENWSGWRGPRGDGTSRETGVPVHWDGASGKNVQWKIEVPGEGHASPVIWADRIFVTSCVTETNERILYCLSRDTGKTLWQRTVLVSPPETKHRLNSFASSTPATDGRSVFVAFQEVDGHTIPARNVGTPRPMTPGRMVVASYDLAGERKWLVKPGEFISVHGFCSNPVIYEDLVILNGDHDGDGYLVALDRGSGEPRWRVAREHNTRSYVTPLIRKLAGRTQLVLSGSEHVASYDPTSGERYWHIDGPTEQFVASMVDNGELLFLTGGYPDRHILAIQPDGTGNVTRTHIAWRTHRGAGYVPSPIVEGKYFLIVTDKGIASCFDAKTGERFWMERLKGSHSASLVSAGGLVYFLSDDGVMTVVRPGARFQSVTRSELGERCSASPAISGGRIYLRGEKHLYAIGGKPQR